MESRDRPCSAANSARRAKCRRLSSALAAYGGMQRIADKVFLLTPRDVELSAEDRARYVEGGFFNQA